MKTILTFLVLQSFIGLARELPPAQSIFMQGNNINTVFRTDGYFNYDKVAPGGSIGAFIWPATSPQRLTAIFATGIFIGAKVGPQSELRLSASLYSSHFSPGNIPVIGQVPPQSVCSDPSWRGYYVQLTDPALLNGGTRLKTAGGRLYTFNYDSWANWPVAKGAPFVEVNGIPGYQPAWNGDRPGIGNGMKTRPDELLFMVYMDYTNCINDTHEVELGLPGGSLPLGAEIHQLSFMFNCPPLRDMYFVKYFIINKSSNVWDSTYTAIVSDNDIGDAIDDATGCDTIRNMGFIYNRDNNDIIYGNNPPAVGIRLLQSPHKFTGNNNDTLKLPYDTLIGYKAVGMTTHNSFKNSPFCYRDPEFAYEAYWYLKGLNGCGEPMYNWVTGQPTKFRYPGDACNRLGWYDSVSGDKKNFIGSGPFTMNVNDTQVIVSSFMVTREGGNNLQNVCAVQSISDSALYNYYHDFRNCVPLGIQPISSEIPQKFELHQNYPNPFNPITKLKFQMPKSEFVKLTLFDVTGREIEILLNEELKPGIYEINWDAANYPSGVYFYSIVTGSYTQTKKMVLLK